MGCLERDNDDVLRRALDFEEIGRRERGRPKMTWKRQVEKHINWYVGFGWLALRSSHCINKKCFKCARCLKVMEVS